MSRHKPFHDRRWEAYRLGQRFERGEISRRTFLKRAAALSLATPAVTAFLAGARPAAALAQDAEPNTELTASISTIANFGQGAEEAAWNKRIDDFMALFPNVSVERRGQPDQTFYDIVPLVNTQIAGGNPPDTIRVGNFSGALFAARDALLPLNEFIENDPDLDWEDFYPVAQAAFQLDGNIFALPENGESYGINYNKTAFEEKGLPDPREQWEAGEWTQEAFLEAAQALTEGEGADKRFGFLFEDWHSENWVFFNDGQVLGTDLSVLIDEPAAYEGLQFAADLANVHGVAPRPTEFGAIGPAQRFSEGNARMYLLGGWFIANFVNGIEGFEYQTAGPPIGPGGKTSKLEISGYAISKDSADPQAAWEFIKYITGPEGQRTWSPVGTPTRLSILDEFLATNEFAQWYEPFVEVLATAQHTPFIAESGEIAQILTDGQAPIFLGQVDAQSAAAEMAAQMREVLGQ